MFNIIDKLQSIINKNSSLTQIDFILTQQILKQHNIAPLPQDFITFLKSYNGFENNGGTICGIYKNKNIDDISILNTSILHPLHKDLVFLGYDDFDYLAYNQRHQVYQIIDKDDLEVLEEYTDLSLAIQHILKIDYE